MLIFRGALICAALAVTRVAVGVWHSDENVRERAGMLIDEKTLLYLGVAGGLLLLKDVKSLAYGDLKLEFDQKIEQVRLAAENAQAAATGQGGKVGREHAQSEAVKQLGQISPGSVPDDPWKGVFGESENESRRLEAKVIQSANTGYYRVYLRLSSLNPEANPLKGSVQFFLHDTFANSKPVVAVGPNGVAELALDAWGAFTVGAIADSGLTRLELDLAEIDEAPSSFKSLQSKWPANQPLEWTGHHLPSAAPPQAPSLPLRGSVSPQAVDEAVVQDYLPTFQALN